MAPKSLTDYGGGLKLSRTGVDIHPAGPPRHGEFGQAERAFTLASTFLSGVLAITASQFLGAPLKLIDPEFYDAYMAYTKESFAVLITSLTQWWAPTVVRVSGDESMDGQLIQMKDGSLRCNFSERLVLMANHQLYTDWLYLWWIAYTNKMHGRVYIILKESLKNIPILGWGAQFYNFIFLARNWETDKPRFKKALSHLNNPKNPMWLVIFPEGTNLSSGTRETSKTWAKKNGLQDMKHQLLPRSTGLRFCLQELKDTTEWLYDCTIGYEGVPPGQFGQDVFTLRSSFLEGRPPKSVNMHWRRFKITDIPIDRPKAFEVWLRNRWREKDYMLEHFRRHRRFPANDYWKSQLADVSDDASSVSSLRSVPKPAHFIETEVKSGKFEEFLRIFAPITGLAMALFIAYGATPDELPFPNGQEFLQQHLGSLLGAGAVPKSIGDFDRLIESGPVLPVEPKIPELGKSAEDKRKQEKYLRLFKETLPPDIVKDAQRRIAVAAKNQDKLCKTAPVKRAPTKSLTSSVKEAPGVARGQPTERKALSTSQNPTKRTTGVASTSATKALSSVSSIAPKRSGAAPAVKSVPRIQSSVSTAKPTTRLAQVNGVTIPIVTSGKPVGTGVNQSKPRTAMVNGVTIQLADGAGTSSQTKPQTAKSNAAATKGNAASVSSKQTTTQSRQLEKPLNLSSS